jgi:hypothetical protein
MEAIVSFTIKSWSDASEISWSCTTESLIAAIEESTFDE